MTAKLLPVSALTAYLLFAPKFLLKSGIVDASLQALRHFSLEPYHYDATFAVKMVSPNISLGPKTALR